MTTTNVKTIKTDGGDYTSLQNWQSGRAADITAATGSDSIEEAVCYAKEDPNLTIQGWTTAPGNYIYIHCDSTGRHAGVWDEAKFHMVQVNYGNIYVYEEYVRLDGLQILVTVNDGSGRTALGVNINAGGNDVTV